jgi:hypothetical protein
VIEDERKSSWVPVEKHLAGLSFGEVAKKSLFE